MVKKTRKLAHTWTPQRNPNIRMIVYAVDDVAIIYGKFPLKQLEQFRKLQFRTKYISSIRVLNRFRFVNIFLRSLFIKLN